MGMGRMTLGTTLGDDVDLEGRIKNQFPTLSITLLSVLIALCFSDLVAEAHSRMTLWPLNVGTLRTSGQIFAMGTCALSSWVFLAHIGISRLRPTLEGSLIVFLTPVPLLIGNSFVGLAAFFGRGSTMPASISRCRWDDVPAGPRGEQGA